MKRIFALILTIMMITCAVGAFAEESSQPPEPPEGAMGQPPEGMGEPPQGGKPPQGGPGGPGGPGGEPPQGAPGDAPGGQQNEVEGQLGSWSLGGTDADSVGGDDYAYDAALYITADGIDDEKSATERITSGEYDASGASGIVIDDSASGHNGILVVDADYAITGATIDMLTDADGNDTCDFSGKGTAIAAFGSGANVTIEDSTIHTSGVATMPIFADEGATLTFRNSTLQSDGGTLSADYLNTPSQTLMVAPPWILGIMGNARGSNMMGRDTTTNVIDSETSAGAWAVLSTDAGDDMYLNVYNSTLTLNKSNIRINNLGIPVTCNFSVIFGSSVTNCSNMFSNYYGFNTDITIPDGVTDCYCMFNNCTNFNRPVSIPENVINCYGMFRNCNKFNQPVTIPAGVGNINHMFHGCWALNSPVNILTNRVNCLYLFHQCYSFNTPVIIPNGVRSCQGMFDTCNSFNQPVSIPDSVTYCYGMFNNCQSFNQPVTLPPAISACSYMFYNCRNFRQSINIPDGAEFVPGGECLLRLRCGS